MKKVTELVKELTNENIDSTLKSIIANDDIILKALTEREKFAVLLFRELKKAIDNDKFEIVLDCNYARSKFSVSKVDYYRVIDKITKTSHIQVYTRLVVASNQANFRICTSCKEVYIEQLQSLGFVVKRDKKTGRAKTSEKLNISYDNIVKTIQDVLNVFTSYESAKSAETSAESAQTSAESAESAQTSAESAESAQTASKTASKTAKKASA